MLIACVVGSAALYFTGMLSRITNSWAAEALSSQQIDEGLAWIEWSRRLGPHLAETEFLLARACRKQGQLDAMTRHLRRAASLGAERERLRREEVLAAAQSGRLSGRFDELDKLLLDDRGDGAEILEAYVNGLLIESDYQRAEYLLQSWIEAFPDDPQPHYLKGRVHRHLRNFEAAEDAFRAALERDAEHHAAAYQMGTMFLERNRVDEAVSLLERCLAMKWNAIAKLGLARCYREKGEADKARPFLEELVALPEEVVERSFQRVGQPREGWPAAFELGQLELATGNYDAALKWLQKAIDANPDDLDTRYAWAIALRHTGDAERSLEELQRVNEARQALTEVDRLVDQIDPLQPYVAERFRIGELYMEYGSKRTGEFWLKSVLHYAPRHAEAHRLLAEYYAQLATKDPRYESLAAEHRMQAAVAPEASEEEAESDSAEAKPRS